MTTDIDIFDPWLSDDEEAEIKSHIQPFTDEEAEEAITLLNELFNEADDESNDSN